MHHPIQMKPADTENRNGIFPKSSHHETSHNIVSISELIMFI